MLAPALSHGLLAGAGQTELPTCPVCLERLDEHISGVVTTVRMYLCTAMHKHMISASPGHCKYVAGVTMLSN